METFEYHKPALDGALNQFCDMWWPCTYSNIKGKRCINSSEGHARGHQDERGKPIGDGGYQSDFTPDTYRHTWHANLRDYLVNIQKLMERISAVSISNRQSDEAVRAAEQHLRTMNEFYQNLGGAALFQSNAACLSCLGDMPEHPLPCGHVICSLCVQMFGVAQSKTAFILNRCPLHNDRHLNRSVHVALKPNSAGVRVLSLDGYVAPCCSHRVPC